jgi:cellulose synthase/poly-beta-1,6-N-acetylglucosamine synthase-like glycosyltransferase
MKTQILHFLTAIHFLSIGGLAIYGMHRIWMIICWFKRPSTEIDPLPACPSVDELPVVTVQIPLYNESLVACRIIDAVAALHWPVKKLEIQVLDDSTDNTSRIVKERVAYWSSTGLDIYAIYRNHRTGYKAGALANGLKRSRGEFVAIFDADFVPQPDFLKKTIPHFKCSDVGMVQAKWGFLNTGYSWLTRLQALLLSTHFGVEHEVRYSLGLFFNFNGTAGIWRKTAIEAAGGWQPDTVTEDLDLSYRAQMAGWRFVYVNNVVVPSELPITLSDFRCQQERWAKGAIQTAKKHLPKLITSSLSVNIKIEAMAHLLANFCWMFGFIATLTLYPVLLTRIGIGVYQIIWIDLPLFLLTGVAVLMYYAVYGLRTSQKIPFNILMILPAASIGMAPFFSLAVLKGLFRKGGVFNRTPKFGVLDKTRIKRLHFAVQPHILTNLVINIPLLIYTLVPVLFAWQRETWPAIPFLCFFPLGFCIVVAHDLHEFFNVLIRR